MEYKEYFNFRSEIFTLTNIYIESPHSIPKYYLDINLVSFSIAKSARK